jgi:hypothetical protein
MRKSLFVLFSILILAAALTACPSQTSTSSSDNASTDTSASADNSNTGQTEMSDADETSEEGSESLPTDASEETGENEEPAEEAEGGTIPLADLPDGWRDDIPLMQGFEIREFSGLPNGGMFAMTQGDVDPIAVYNFYKELPGWDVDPDAPVGTHEDDRSLGFKKSDGTFLLIAIIRENNETLLNFSAHK